MTDLVFNTALGAVKKYAQQVDANTPAASVLRMHAWVITAADADIGNQDTIAELEALSLSTEATNSGYAPAALSDADVTVTVDDTNDWVDVFVGDTVFTSIIAGSNWTHVSLSYDDSGSDADAVLLLLTLHDFVVTPNGGNITADEGVNGFYRAT